MDPPSTIDISELIDNKIDLKMSDVFNKISYISLEAGKDIYLNRIDNIILDDDFCLVSDIKNRKLLQFNKNGIFIKEFMKWGRGPDEFTQIGCMDANEDRELLILRSGRYLDIYGFNGENKKTINLKATPKEAIWINQEIIALIYPFPLYYYNEGYEVTFIDRDGKVIKETLKRDFDEEKRGRGSKIRCGRNNGSVYYWNHQCDTIYTITNELDIFPRYVFQHDERHIPVEKYSDFDFQPNLKNQYTVESYYEWGNYVFIYIAYDNRRVCGVINRDVNLKGDVIANYNKWTFRGLLNNIDGGVPFWPYQTQIDGSLVNAVDPSALIETFNHNHEIGLSVDDAKQQQLKDSIVDKINMMSNPVLIQVK